MSARRRRIWALLLVACGAEEALPTAPPLPTLAAVTLSTLAVTPAPAPANQTAAEVAVGEIAAQAAAAAGASLEDVVQSAANGAGLDAAKTARAEGQTEAQVEKAAASAAEAAAQTAGATKEQAAKAAGQATVEVSKSKDTVAAAAITDAWSLVPGTECLNWWGDGCASITDEDACLTTRDGSGVAMTAEGYKSFGQPCVWCGGTTCDEKSTLASVCSPRSVLPEPLPASFTVASCSGKGTPRASMSDLWRKSVPVELQSGGFQSRSLNFEPMRNPGDNDEGGRACRAKSIEDASNPNPFARNYYSTWTADLKECFAICSWKQDCTGIEHEEKNHYCEVWNAPIEWVAPLDGYKCFKAMPPASNASAGAVRWRGDDAYGVEGTYEPAHLPTYFWVLGAIIAAAVAVAICFVWKSRKRKKVAKRSAKAAPNEPKSEELQPLVGASSPTGSSVPSFAGSFQPPAQGLPPWYARPASDGYPVGDGYPMGEQGDSYLQQLRQWLQQYESARFQELAQLQNSQAPVWGHAPAWA